MPEYKRRICTEELQCTFVFTKTKRTIEKFKFSRRDKSSKWKQLFKIKVCFSTRPKPKRYWVWFSREVYIAIFIEAVR